MNYDAFSIGLTGGIGSGKTLVANLFSSLGAAIVDADEVARSLTAPGGEGIALIRDAFGSQFIQPDGAMNRAMMRKHVFSNADERLRLEAILHPLIRDVSFYQAREAVGDYVIFVNPLLLDLPIWHGMGTRILVVDCPEELQVSRVMKRSGISEEQVRAIIKTQVTREKRLSMADDVIENDKDINHIVQKVEYLHAIYKKLAKILYRYLYQSYFQKCF